MEQIKEAMYYDRLEGNRIKCRLCPHECTVAPGKYGICKVRANVEGTLYVQNYGKLSAVAMDPVEKKPLYHFYPGKYLLSLGTVGCNFRCSFCQNYHIAQRGAEADAPAEHFHEASAGYLLSLCRQEEDCVGVAYTYNEPSIWYEYVLDTSRYFRSKGYKNVLVTNGYIGEKALAELLPYIDAMNIDVKGFTEAFYRDICGGELAHVKNTVMAAAKKCHVEITTLVIPGLNDSEAEMDELTNWLSEINPSIPLHLSRYFPRYHMDIGSTPPETLKRLKSIAAANLEYVYVGNLQSRDSNTFCPKCGALLIRREDGIFIEHLDEGICSKCGKEIAIIGLA